VRFGRRTQLTAATTQKKKSTASDFEKKLVRYALMGGAVLGASTASHAAIITTPENQYIPDGGSFAVSFDNSATTDFTIYASSGFTEFDGFPYAGVFVSGPPSNTTTQFVGAKPFEDNAAFALAGGTTISSSSPFVPNGAKLAKVTAGDYTGYWDNNTVAFLGVSFQRSGNTYYGWAEMSVDVTEPFESGSLSAALAPGPTASAYLYSIAYNNVPNGQIVTPSGIPEPASLSLFALGAIGIAALKKRRKSA
jgi:hypothetical protein